MRSIIQDKEECWFCKDTFVEEHHCFGGANRKFSEKYGLKVYLCHNHHNEPPFGVHFNKEAMDKIRRVAQAKFEETHTREEFMRIFGRNYL